jgi:hypothetical protein
MRIRLTLLVVAGLTALTLSTGLASARRPRVHLLPTRLTCGHLLDGSDLGSSTIKTTSDEENPCVYVYQGTAPYPYPVPPLVSGGMLICLAKAGWTGGNLLHRTFSSQIGHPSRPTFVFPHIGTRAEIFNLDEQDEADNAGEVVGEVQVNNAWCQIRLDGRGPGYIQNGSYVVDSGGTVPSGVQLVPAASGLEIVAKVRHALEVIASELGDPRG